MQQCASCGTEIAIEASSEPCPHCGNYDRAVLDGEHLEGHDDVAGIALSDGDQVVGDDDWSELKKRFGDASPAELSEALTELAADLGTGIKVDYDGVGVTITYQNGSS